MARPSRARGRPEAGEPEASRESGPAARPVLLSGTPIHVCIIFGPCARVADSRPGHGRQLCGPADGRDDRAALARGIADFFARYGVFFFPLAKLSLHWPS